MMGNVLSYFNAVSGFAFSPQEDNGRAEKRNEEVYRRYCPIGPKHEVVWHQ